MLDAVLEGLARYHSSVCAVLPVPDVPGTSVIVAAPYFTSTVVPAPEPNDSPTTRRRFDPAPGLKAVMVTVVAADAFLVAVLWKATGVLAVLVKLPTAKLCAPTGDAMAADTAPT